MTDVEPCLRLDRVGLISGASNRSGLERDVRMRVDEGRNRRVDRILTFELLYLQIGWKMCHYDADIV